MTRPLPSELRNRALLTDDPARSALKATSPEFPKELDSILEKVPPNSAGRESPPQGSADSCGLPVCAINGRIETFAGRANAIVRPVSRKKMDSFCNDISIPSAPKLQAPSCN